MHVELLTITQDELAGTRYVIDGGTEQSCEDAGCAQGTTIIVRDLFYNTPARMAVKYNSGRLFRCSVPKIMLFVKSIRLRMN